MGAAVSFIRIPTTETSVPFATAYLAGEGFGVDLAAYGYVEEEYLIPGAANVYEYGDGWELKVRNADLSFVTRLLVRRPAAASDFSGVVLVEPLHPLQENALGWFNTHPYLLRSGHAWAGLSCQPANIEVMKQWDPARYETLSFVDHGLGWEAMARVAQCLKEGAPGSPLTDFDVQRIYMSGGSYTGSWQRNFLADGFHDRARLADGSHVIDGFLIMISSGIFARTGMLPPNGQSGSLPVSDPRRVMQPHGVPVFEMLSEFEAETNYYGRRPDNDAPEDRFRLVEIAGASHSSGPPSTLRQVVPVQLAQRGMPVPFTPPPGSIDPANEFPYAYFATAALDNIHRWATEGTPPPRAERLQVNLDRNAGRPGGAGLHGISPEALPLDRDELGNALGGLRNPYVDHPFARYFPHTTKNEHQVEQASDLRGSQHLFDADTLHRLHGTPEAYVAKVEAQVDALVRERWLLAPEGELIKQQARGLRF
jgi:hypothetical protein